MYTINKEQIVYDRLSRDVDLIVSEIRDKIPRVEAIYLTGGFGRGEGSVVTDKGMCQPLNDYDVTVITSWKIKKDDLRNVRLRIAELCGIRQVDIDLKSPDSLRSLKNTMANYDLQAASTQIFGEYDFRTDMPNREASTLPLKEGITPLFLFLSSLIQAAPSSKPMTDNQIFWGYQQITKSILGWSTAMLIFEGAYTPLYQKRCDRFQETFVERKDLCKLVIDATEFKLAPVLHPCSQSKYPEIWSAAVRTHLDIMFDLLNSYYGSDFKSWSPLITRHRLSINGIAKFILSFIFQKHHFYDCLNTDIAKLYFCLSFFDSKALKDSKKYFKKISKNKRISLEADKDRYRLQLISSDINASMFFDRGHRIFYK